MTPNERRAELMRQGIQMKDIASHLGIRPQHISQVIANNRRTRYVQKAIAAAIGKPINEVFPETASKEAV